MYNESLLPAPLVVQLYDKFGNMAPEANVKIALGKTSGFKVNNRDLYNHDQAEINL